MKALASFFRSLTNRLRIHSPRPPLHLTMYTRQGCHLCVDALAELRRQQKSYSYSLKLVDIDTDPELVAQHGNCVPVVAVNGKVRFRGQVNPVLLDRLLRAEAGRGSDAETRD